jgi:hypothetical protein
MCFKKWHSLPLNVANIIQDQVLVLSSFEEAFDAYLCQLTIVKKTLLAHVHT